MPPQQVTTVEPDVVVFRLPSRDAAIDRLRLWSDFDRGDITSFRRVDGGWELRLPTRRLPPVD
jgi:hypothetical protein